MKQMQREQEIGCVGWVSTQTCGMQAGMRDDERVTDLSHSSRWRLAMTWGMSWIKWPACRLQEPPRELMQHISHTALRQCVHMKMQVFAGCVEQAAADEATVAAAAAATTTRFAAGLAAPPSASGRLSSARATFALGTSAKFLGRRAGPRGAGVERRQEGQVRAGVAASLRRSAAQEWHMQCLEGSVR